MFKNNFPFKASNFPFYYGLIILPAAMLGVLMSIPGQTAGFSAFTNPLLKDLQIDRTILATGYFAGTACSGFLLPYAGKVLDRIGTRKAIFIVSLSFGVVLFLFSNCQIIFAFLEKNLPFIDRSAIYTVGLISLFFGLRFFGQGMLPVISNTMVSRWFEQHRGRVFAIMGVINSICFNSAPAILSLMIDNYNWQTTWKILAFIAGVIFLIFSWIFFRDNPEECGLEVDGVKHSKNNEDYPSPKSKEIQGFTVEEAVKTTNFKVITAALALYGMTLTGITFNLEEIGKQAGLTKSQAMSIFIPVSLIAIPVGFITAYFSEKFPKKHLVVILCLAQSSAYISTIFISNTFGFCLTAIFLGFSGGMYGPIVNIAYPWYFGRKHLGAINGKANSLIVIGSAVGPLIFAIFQKLTGTFSTALLVCAIFPLINLLFSHKITSEKMYKIS